MMMSAVSDNTVNLNMKIVYMLRYNTWVTNKKQEKALLWYNLIGQTTIERRTNSCARIIPQKLTIVNVCLSMGSCQVLLGEIKRRDRGAGVWRKL